MLHHPCLWGGLGGASPPAETVMAIDNCSLMLSYLDFIAACLILDKVTHKVTRMPSK